MRFSLMTLLIFTLWAGAGLAVWFYREPWVVERTETDLSPVLINLHDANYVQQKMPDDFRDLTNFDPYSIGFNNPYNLCIVDRRRKIGAQVLYDFGFFEVSNAVVRSDDAIEVSEWNGDKKAGGVRTVFFRRRFPEWWWGHLYRPEVWAFALLSIALIVQAIQALRRRRLAREV